MPIRIKFFSLVIPIRVIDEKYPGGFEQYKLENAEAFSSGIWHDDYLFRDSTMDPDSMEFLVKEWVKLGLTDCIDVDGKEHWADMCVVDSLGGPTLPCSWLKFDYYVGSASHVLDSSTVVVG